VIAVIEDSKTARDELCDAGTGPHIALESAGARSTQKKHPQPFALWLGQLRRPAGYRARRETGRTPDPVCGVPTSDAARIDAKQPGNVDGCPPFLQKPDCP
jgi:hypothetical protein